MDNEKIFELMTKMYSEMQEGFNKVNKRFDSVDKRIDATDKRIDGLENQVKKTNLTIENGVNPKLDALFDGYKQNSEKLQKIEDEVAKHEEVIIRRVK